MDLVHLQPQEEVWHGMVKDGWQLVKVLIQLHIQAMELLGQELEVLYSQLEVMEFLGMEMLG